MKITPTYTTTDFKFTTSTTEQFRRIAPMPPPLEFDYPFKKMIEWIKPRIKPLIFLIITSTFLYLTWIISHK